MGQREAPSVGEVFSERVRRYREAAGLRQDDLAERTAELGWPMNRVTLAKIEKGGTRADNASLVDVLVLAAALDVPPVLLFVPLGDTEEMVITPAVTTHPHLVHKWMAGREPFTIDRYAHDLTEWHRNALPVFLFDKLEDLQQACSRAGAGDEDFRRLADHLEIMAKAGFSVPEMAPETLQRIKEATNGKR